MMRLCSLSFGTFAVAVGLLAGAAIAQAASETWVSGTGTDTGTCQITTPCRTFAYAHSQTNNNGSINVLTSGNFGPLTITKPISIVARGVEAVINNGPGSFTSGILVQAGANAVVSLWGLTIDMRGTNQNGIRFLTGAALHVHDCVIRNGMHGILFEVSGTSELYVADSVIADGKFNGIFVVPNGTGNARVAVDRVRLENNVGSGITFQGDFTSGSITASVRDIVSDGSNSSGIEARGEAGGGTVNLMIDRSAFVNNSSGVLASGAGATIRIGDSTVSGNTFGLSVSASGGAIVSYGTNQVNGNGTDGTTTSTIGMK